MAYPYRVELMELTEAQRADLRGLVGHGIASARILTRARILLKANHGEGGPGWVDTAIATALDVSLSTVQRVRRQFVVEGLAATLDRKRPDRVYARRLDGVQEAHLIALACGGPPMGRLVGACGCWRMNWSGWRWWIPSPMRRCAKPSKKTTFSRI